MRYGIMDDAYRLDENKVGKYTVIFNSKHICRGYELSIKNNTVELNMPLPTSDIEIEYFYDYITKACKMLNAKYFLKDETKATLDKILSYIKSDISLSCDTLKTIEYNIKQGTYENIISL